MAGVVYRTETHLSLQRGTRQIVDAIRPTLGPLPRNVSIAHSFNNRLPELLDNGGVIARRIIELPDRSENTGAMFIRHMLWRIHEGVGDGTATAAVMFQSIYDDGLRYLASGGSAMQLRHYLEQAMKLVLDQLDDMTIPLEGQAMLRQVARTVCHDEEIANGLGDMFDVVGPYGQVELRAGNRRTLELEFVDGYYWKSGVHSKEMIQDKILGRRTLKNVAVFISDLALDDPHDVVPLIREAVNMGAEGLVITAKTISDSILGLLAKNERPGKFEMIAIKTPGTTTGDQTTNLYDLALLTGGRRFLQATGDTAASIQPGDLGFTRRAWADNQFFSVAGTAGDAHELRLHIEDLEGKHADAVDLEGKKELLTRIGRLKGGAGMLHVGGATKYDRDDRKELAKRTADALRGALLDGVLPGGGAALLNCQKALDRKKTSNADEQAAYRILSAALAAPACQLVTNAGYEHVVLRMHNRRANQTFDVVKGKSADALKAGILDSAAVVKTAVRTAIVAASQLLTTEVLVQAKEPEQVTDP